MAAEHNFSLNQTMLRIKDPEKSIPFYQKWFGMTLIQQRDYSDFSLYFLVTLPEGETAPSPGTPEAEIYLKGGTYGCCLELTHNHGTETQQDFKYHNGNVEPRGFGHIGFLVDDVYAFCDEMIKADVPFPKKPDEGGIKGLGFAADPDGYWVEIIKRTESAPRGPPSYQQTMIRVKDLAKSVSFYRDNCGMTEIDRLEFPEWKFTLSFMATIPEADKAALPEPGTEEAHSALWGFKGTTLELTYNHGTEDDPEFKGYDSGNNEPKRGFGHVAMMVDDVYKACEFLEEKGVGFQKKPDEGRMKGLAFALDPDGYWVEIVKRKSEEEVRADIAAREAEAAATPTRGSASSGTDTGHGTTPTSGTEEDSSPSRRLTMAVDNMGPDETIKTGFLFKQGGGFKTWKKRFFVLTSSAIAYYTDQTRHQAELKGGVLLEHIKDCKPAESFDTRKPYAISVETNDRRYLFQAKDNEEMASWIDAIKSAWKRALPSTPESSSLESDNKALREEVAKMKLLVTSKGGAVAARAGVISEAYARYRDARSKGDTGAILAELSDDAAVVVIDVFEQKQTEYNRDAAEGFFSSLLSGGNAITVVGESIAEASGTAFVVWTAPSLKCVTENISYNHKSELSRMSFSVVRE
eukprot:m.428095 g.428095  ORF g.428095 m.428095 type:complete len:635 (-) comp21369_c0_seq2:252-2156(-)